MYSHGAQIARSSCRAPMHRATQKAETFYTMVLARGRPRRGESMGNQQHQQQHTSSSGSKSAASSSKAAAGHEQERQNQKQKHQFGSPWFGTGKDAYKGPEVLMSQEQWTTHGIFQSHVANTQGHSSIFCMRMYVHPTFWRKC